MCAKVFKKNALFVMILLYCTNHGIISSQNAGSSSDPTDCGRTWIWTRESMHIDHSIERTPCASLTLSENIERISQVHNHSLRDTILRKNKKTTKHLENPNVFSSFQAMFCEKFPDVQLVSLNMKYWINRYTE